MSKKKYCYEFTEHRQYKCSECGRTMHEPTSHYCNGQLRKHKLKFIKMKQFNLDEYFKDPSRKVVTRDGRDARIVCTDAHREYPVVALIADCSGDESPETYTKYGRSYVDGQTSSDLFFAPEAPEKHEGWMNICKSGDGYKGSIIWPTEEEAKRCAYPGLSAIVKIEWEE